MNEKEQTGISRMRCSEIMTRDVQTATRDTTLREVALMMRDGDMGSVPVVDDGKLIGIVTDRDMVVRVLAEGKGADTAAGEAYVFQAIRLMGDKQVRRIPVVGENGELAGIIAMADIALETEDEREIADTLEEISSGAGFWKKN
jgi:CBS domain-containing protein